MRLKTVRPVRWLPFLPTLLGLVLLACGALRADSSPAFKFEGWQNTAQTWGGTLTQNNARLTEGDLVNLRCVATLPAGTCTTVTLKYDYTTGAGTTRFFDFLTGSPLASTSVLSGSGLTGNPTDQRALPVDAGTPAQTAGSLKVWGATIKSFGTYKLSKGVKTLSVTLNVPSGGKTKTVVLAYAAHLARSQDYAPFTSTGAASFPGASRKAYLNFDSCSDANVSVNPGVFTSSTDLSVTQTASPAPAIVGSPLSFTLTVRNLGTVSATGVTLVDTAPPGAVISTSQGTVSGNTVALGTLAAGAQALVTVSLNAPCGPVANSATIASTTSDPVTSNNSASTTVTPLDTTPPGITGPANVQVNTDPGAAGARVTYALPVANDSCSATTVTLIAGLPSGSLFPVGTTTVTYEAKDAANNRSTHSFTVTVTDNEPPTLTGVPTVPLIAFAPPASCGATVDLPVVQALDACTASPTLSVSRSDGQALNALFPLGTTHLDYRATDAAGNGVSAGYDVVVVPLNLAWPVATRLLPPEPDPASGLTSVQIEECLGLPGQSRWYKFKVQPNSKVLVTLENLPENYDLVLYSDIRQSYDEMTQAQSAGDLTQLNAEFAADAFSGAAFSTEAFSGAAWSGAAWSGAAWSGAAWSGAAWSGAAFSGAAWSPDVYAPDTFFGAAFSGAAWSGAAFSDAVSAGAAFSGAAFSGAAFSGAAWSGAAWSGAAWSGAAWSGAAFSGAAFSTEAASGAAWSGAAFSGAAFSDAQQRSIIGVSGFPGIGNEVILANTWDNDRDFYVRVRGRNGVFVPGQNYKLSVHMLTGVCNNLTPLEALPASTTTVPAGGTVKSLILTDPTRLARFSGTADDAAAVQARLNQFAARPEIGGLVIDLGQDARVAAAHAQADDRLACPSAKNIVAAAIRELIVRHRTQHPELEYVVIVGNDAVVPFFRHPDQGLLANENNYIPPVLASSASEAALQLGYFLTQDDYAAGCDLTWKTGSLPLPDLGIGRLVETPAEITALLDAYESTPDGVVPTPTTALATGYDFLADTAEAITTEFRAGLGQAVDTLIQPGGQLPSQGWTADQLRAKLLDARHDLIFLGGHFSAVGALAADYQTRLTAAQLAASTVNLVNAIVFSAGCHSGYNLVNTDAVPFVTEDPDWAQAFARKGATLVAGTGYQYGDTDILEYSERLYLNFARELRAGTGPVAVGKALARAKALYLAETPAMRGLHEKALLEAALFGLPMLRVDLPAGRGPLAADTSVVGTAGGTPLVAAPAPGQTFGLQVADLAVAATLTPFTSQLSDLDAGGGATVTATYFAGSGGVVANPAEPLLPLEARNVTVPDQVLRGVGFRAGAYTDEPGLRPLTSAAATELSGVHAPFLSDTFFPIRVWNVNYFDAVCDHRDTISGSTRLFVTPAQFISEDPDSPLGTFRKYSALDFRLYYNNNTTTYTVINSGNPPTISPALSSAPTIESVRDVVDVANPAAQSVKFQVRVLGNPFAGIQEVWVTYTGVEGTPGFHGQWQSLNLTQPDPAHDSALWEGTLAIGSVAPGSLRYIVQAANGVGLVALSTKLGAYYIPGEIDTLPSVATTLTLDPANPGANPPVNPDTIAYGQQATLRATLKTADGTPVAGRTVTFALGSRERRATTGADGVATLTVQVLDFPGSYYLRASFGGDNTYQPSATSTTFAVTKQATALNLQPGSGTYYLPAGTATPFVAALTVEGKGLAERTLFFALTSPTLGSFYFPVITDFAGRATLPSLTPGSVPDGAYSLAVTFGSGIPGQPLNVTDVRYGDATTLGTVVITAVVVNNPTGAVQFPANLTVNSSADGLGDCAAAVVLDGLTQVEAVVAPYVTVAYTIAGQAIPSPALFPVGATPVTVTVRIGTAVVASHDFLVTVIDDEPPAATTKPATLYLNASGQAALNPADVFAAGTDNCGTVTPVSVQPASFGCGQLGPNLVQLTVTDGHGNTAVAQATVTVVDNLAPVARAKNVNAVVDPATGLPTVRAVDVNNGSTDNCSIATLAISKGTVAATSPTFGEKLTFTAAETGCRTITLRVTDAAGNASVATATVNVPDVFAPAGTVTANPAVLSPPNHKLKTVQLTVNVTDPDKARLVYRIACVGSDERLNGCGDGDASPDWVFNSGSNPIVRETLTPSYSITACVRDANYGWSAPGQNVLSLQLRAERAEHGDGRDYTVTVEIRDPAGNVGMAVVHVLVP